VTLINGNERLTLRFDCRAGEMHVMGTVQWQVLKSPPGRAE
jgi:putative protease